MVRILLDQKNRHSVTGQFAQRLENLFNHDWREAEAGFIQQQKFRTAHQRAGDSQHLLFTAGERHRPLVTSLLEAGEEVEHALHIFRCMLIADGDCPHQQVLFYRHIRENASSLRCLRDATGGNIVGGFVADILAAEEDLPVADPGLTKDRHQ